MWFGSNAGVEFVPVESVYAVFEAKPEMDPGKLRYASEKVASVRRLRRTSAAIKHAGGIYRATDPTEKRIIGGILAAHSWATYESAVEKLVEYLPVAGRENSLDIGVALDRIAFDYTPEPNDGQADEPEPELTFSRDGQQLVHFAIRLFDQLQPSTPCGRWGIAAAWSWG